MSLAGTSPATPSTAAIDGFCFIAKPIIYDRLHDTDATLEQVEEHDAVGKRLCGWTNKPPSAKK